MNEIDKTLDWLESLGYHVAISSGLNPDDMSSTSLISAEIKNVPGSKFGIMHLVGSNGPFKVFFLKKQRRYTLYFENLNDFRLWFSNIYSSGLTKTDPIFKIFESITSNPEDFFV